MTDNIKYQGMIKGFPLIKIKSKEIIEKIRKGSFYMNSLKTYRDLYKDNEDNVIGDAYEGKLYIYDATFIIPEKGVNEIIKNKAFSTVNENDFVYCMFGINPNKNSSFNFTDYQKQKLIGFDDTALIITDVYEYFRRIKKSAIESGYEIESNFVQYYDEGVNDLNLFLNLIKGMNNIVFYKRKMYSYQQEYRFTIKNNSGDDHLELDIGDITDISEMFSVTDLFNSYISKHGEK